MGKDLGGYWKPANVIPIKRTKVVYKQKRNKPKFDHTRAREYLVRHYGLHKYASSAAICFVIHKQTGAKLAEQKNQYRKQIKKEYLRLTGKPNIRKYRPKSDTEFYNAQAWKELRYIVLKKYGGICMLCGAKAADGVSIHVDHIVPRSVAPAKALDINNMQVLCSDCNQGKSNFDDTNWRQHWESI